MFDQQLAHDIFLGFIGFVAGVAILKAWRNGKKAEKAMMQLNAFRRATGLEIDDNLHFYRGGVYVLLNTRQDGIIRVLTPAEVAAGKAVDGGLK